jgi:hypothetical protein
MKIADTVRDLIERNADAPDGADIIVLGTNDRDFRTIMETAKQRGQRVMLLALRHNVSKHLRQVVDDENILYLNDYLEMPQETQKEQQGKPSTTSPKAHAEHALLSSRIAHWLNQQGNRGWLYAPLKAIEQGLRLTEVEKLQVEKAVKSGVLLKQKRVVKGEMTEIVQLNQNNALAKAIHRLVHWAPGRIDYTLNHRGMPYVDTNFLAKGMQMDNQLKEQNVGQSWREAEEWLRLLETASVVSSEERTNQHGKSITAWLLPQKPKPPQKQDALEGGPDDDPIEPVETDTPIAVNEVKLLDTLTNKYDLEELKTLSFRIGIEFDTLRGEGKVGKARELITTAKRFEKTIDLAKEVEKSRPGASANWLTPDSIDLGFVPTMPSQLPIAA